jgi:hypothetical protein
MPENINNMSAAELRAALDEFTRGGRPPAPPAPLPPGFGPNDSQKSQETASQLYAEAILRKQSGSWTQAERDFIRGSVSSTLRDMGY